MVEPHPLLETVKKFPKRSGVYLMKDASGVVIYVGKAKKLSSRVRSYFTGGDDRHTIPHILKRVVTIEVIVTESEHAAFVLERDLITKYKPRYNIRLKDDKAYLHVRIDRRAPWPKLELTRRPVEDGAEYFGPYTFSYELRTVLDLIKRVVPLRTCNDTVFFNRTRPCLEYQIKRCAGPCCLEVDEKEYEKWVEQAITILQGRTSSLAEDLEEKMEEASEELRFEDAALYRDRLEVVQNFTTKQGFISQVGDSYDVFALYREETLLVLSVLHVRNGRIDGNVNYSLEGVEISNEQVLESALMQFYQGGRVLPKEIIVPFALEVQDLLLSELETIYGTRPELTRPQRGSKFRLLGLAELNAKEHFLTTFDSSARYQRISEALARTLQLSQVPRRIECIDISNLQGSDVVGAVVSFYDGEPDRTRYRSYRLKVDGKPDDFASVEEVVRRKLQRAKDEPDLLPCLLIIDGGKGQLTRALQVRDEFGLLLDIIALAKRRDSSGKKRGASARGGDIKGERVFLPRRKDSSLLDPTMESTRLLQRIRDEAHRSVIEFHRKVRNKRVHSSQLDKIPGVGPERRARLLRAFGSIKKIASSEVEEVAKAGRMPKSLAEKVIRFLRGSSTEQDVS